MSKVMRREGKTESEPRVWGIYTFLEETTATVAAVLVTPVAAASFFRSLYVPSPPTNVARVIDARRLYTRYNIPNQRYPLAKVQQGFSTTRLLKIFTVPQRHL